MSLCAMISTIDDAILEGDHDFTVAIDSFVPSTAVTVGGANSFDITLTDAADGMKIHAFSYMNLIRLGIYLLQVQPLLMW